ncbi:uncharacterized protein At5g64816-like [Lathyrus oleraceus]|uniref:uncharacterized protein At5g64816-like n=1 Tax=Pisum sativum TaxID=3888 RepID=UPI0021D3BF8F|nr:uncharacterized protein At5g64816-like [Pisum sativum]
MGSKQELFNVSDCVIGLTSLMDSEHMRSFNKCTQSEFATLELSQMISLILQSHSHFFLMLRILLLYILTGTIFEKTFIYLFQVYASAEILASTRGRERSFDEFFVCEKVCTSNRMLKKVAYFSKDPIPDNCVTIYGVSDLDACDDACAHTVCVNQHQVPSWNDICLRRCQSECLKLSSQSS